MKEEQNGNIRSKKDSAIQTIQCPEATSLSKIYTIIVATALLEVYRRAGLKEGILSDFHNQPNELSQIWFCHLEHLTGPGQGTVCCVRAIVPLFRQSLLQFIWDELSLCGDIQHPAHQQVCWVLDIPTPSASCLYHSQHCLPNLTSAAIRSPVPL